MNPKGRETQRSSIKTVDENNQTIDVKEQEIIISTRAKTPRHKILDLNHSHIKSKLKFTPVLETRDFMTPNAISTNRITNEVYTNR